MWKSKQGNEHIHKCKEVKNIKSYSFIWVKDEKYASIFHCRP
jgi:hypothetical protein